MSSRSLIVDVWYARIPNADDRAALEQLEQRLTAQELEQEQQYRLPEVKAQFSTTRVLTRSVLAERAGCEAARLEFEVGPHGKPRLCRPADCPCAFNISHTRGAVLLAIAEQGEVGIDVERSDRRVNLELANRYFAGQEVQQLLQLDADQRERRFLELWTLKEAFIKALGTGLATPLHNFAFQFTSQESTGVELYDAALGPPDRWLFRQFELDQEFLAAVAVMDSAASDLDVRLRPIQLL